MRRHSRRRVSRCSCQACQQHPFSAVAKEHHAIKRVLATLDEKNRRRFVGVLALQGGRGSISALATITGLSRNTIRRGRKEIQRSDRSARVRQSGGGRQPFEKSSRRF